MSSTARRTARLVALVAALPLALSLVGGGNAVAEYPVVVGPSGAETTVQGPFAPAKASTTSANTTTTDVYNPVQDTAGQGGKSRGYEAGSVGRADHKQPKGQLRNADADGNRGYECDGNNGIALGNPAHSGCTLDVMD